MKFAKLHSFSCRLCTAQGHFERNGKFFDLIATFHFKTKLPLTSSIWIIIRQGLTGLLVNLLLCHTNSRIYICRYFSAIILANSPIILQITFILTEISLLFIKILSYLHNMIFQQDIW